MTAVRIDGELVHLSPVGAQALRWALADQNAGRPLAAIHPACRLRLIALGLLSLDSRSLTDRGVEVAAELEAAGP